eukprot:m.10543 g.10543  ORF g.10543 m.10543 type:complete len:801 (+) comp22403_c0_seq1:97-2499(+)
MRPLARNIWLSLVVFWLLRCLPAGDSVSVSIVPAAGKEGSSACSGSCHGEKVDLSGNIDLKALNDQQLKDFAERMALEKRIQFATNEPRIDSKLAYATLLVNAERYDESIKHFTSLLKERPKLYGALVGRGTAYSYKGIEDSQNAQNALNDFSKAIKLDPKNQEGLERRAEVYTHLNRLNEAILDVNTALAIKKTSDLYFLGGRILSMMGKFQSAHFHLKEAYKMNSRHLDTMRHLALSFYNSGDIMPAMRLLAEALGLYPSDASIPFFLGEIYREMGSFKESNFYYSEAIQLNAANPNAFYGRGLMFYSNGKYFEALADFESCQSFSPHNVACVLHGGIVLTALGKFFPAIKEYTKVSLLGVSESYQGEYIEAPFLKEYSRYLHSKLDLPLHKLESDSDLDERFRNYWTRQEAFDFQNYTEQPGIQPYTSDVDTPYFEELDVDSQALLCKANRLGSFTQYTVQGFMPSLRQQLSMGYAILEIAQRLHELWKPKKVMLTSRSHEVTWRDLYNVAVQWRRIVDPSQPIFWFDSFTGKPSKKLDSPTQLVIIRQHQFVFRYSGYLKNIIDAIKSTVHENKNMYKNVDEKLLKEAKDCPKLMKALEGKRPKEGKILDHSFQLKVPSCTGARPKSFDGIKVLLSGNSNRSDSLNLSLDLSHSKKTTPGKYIEELKWLWNEFTKEAVKKERDAETLWNHAVFMVYYFINLFPLTRGTTASAVGVLLGMLASVGLEVTEPIPEEKMFDMEAWLALSADKFLSRMTAMFNLTKSTVPLHSMPSVKDTLPSLRYSLEMLNLGAENCPK